MRTLTSETEIAPRPSRRSRAEVLLVAGFVYLGAVVPLPQYVGGRFAGFGLQLLVGLALAFVGWTRAGGVPAPGRYMLPASLTGAWAMIAAIAAWNGTIAYESFTFLVWLVFIVPGLAFLLRRVSSYRSAMLFGFASGIVVYGTTVLYRKATGRPATDVGSNELVGGLILNENRNLIAMSILIVMPYLLMRVWPARFRWTRWALAVLGGATVVLGGGRSGLLGLAAFLVLTALVQPGVGSRVRRTLAVAMVGVTFLIVTQALGGDVARSTDRILEYFGDEKDDSDKARDLASRKAWHLAFDHPAFGVGYKNFQLSYHPVVEEAENSAVRWHVDRLIAHNSYAQVMAELGFPGLFAFVLMLGTLFVGCLRRVDSVEVRCAAAGFGAILLMIAFDHTLGMILYLPMAIVLAARGRADGTVRAGDMDREAFSLESGPPASAR